MNAVNHFSKRQRSLKALVARPAASMRLLCFPYAGGSATIFRRWADFCAEIEFIGAQYRGRGARIGEQPHHSIGELVAEAVIDIEDLSDKPYAIFGHSMGAMVAFDFARKLAEIPTRQPDHVFLSGLASPWTRVIGKRIHDLPDRDFLYELRDLGGTPPDILGNSDILEIILPVIRADLEAAYYWRVNEHGDLRLPITVFGGADDQGIPTEALADWASCTSGSVEVHLHPGGHFFIHDEFPAVIDSVCSQLFGAPRQSIHERSNRLVTLSDGQSKTLPFLRHSQWRCAVPEI